MTIRLNKSDWAKVDAAVKQFIDKGNCSDRVVSVKFNNGATSVQREQCHAYIGAIGAYGENAKAAVGTAISKMHNSGPESYQEWMTFLLGLDKNNPSPYQKIIDHLGDRLHIIRVDGLIRGYIVDDPASAMDYKYFHNFMKASRWCTEHFSKMQFWEKLAEHGNKSLAYMLSGYFSSDGSKLTADGHSPIENAVLKGSVNLKNFVYPLDNNWDLKVKATVSYGSSGENRLAWGGGKFDPHTHIRAIGYRDIKTFFWSKYNNTTPKVVSFETLTNFMKEVEEGKYDEYL